MNEQKIFEHIMKHHPQIITHENIGKPLSQQDKIYLVNEVLLRHAWISLLTNKNNTYVVTLAFKEGTSDEKIISIMKKFIICLNQRVYKNSYKLKGTGENAYRKKYLDGIFVGEYQQNGTLHFHIIFRSTNGYLPEYKVFNRHIWQIIAEYNYSYRGICSNQFTNVQAYYESESKYDGIICNQLEKYLTKNFEVNNNVDEPDANAGFYLLEPEGFSRPN